MAFAVHHSCGHCNCTFDNNIGGKPSVTKVNFYEHSICNSVDITEAIEFIYGIKWTDIAKDLQSSQTHSEYLQSENEHQSLLDNNTAPSLLTFCTACAKLLEMCYSDLKNFESVSHPNSALHQARNLKSNELCTSVPLENGLVKLTNISTESIDDSFANQ